MRWVSWTSFVPSMFLMSTLGTDGLLGTVQLIDAVDGVAAGVTVTSGAPGGRVGVGVGVPAGRVGSSVGEMRGVGVVVGPMVMGPDVTVPVLTSGAKVSS